MRRTRSFVIPLALGIGVFAASHLEGSGAFLFADSGQRHRIAHPIGYQVGGEDQHLVITVGIVPTSPSRELMVIPTLNVIHKWNKLEGMLPNVFLGPSSGIPYNTIDFESVLLHEMGHALGMAHPNLATESGQPVEFQDYTRSTRGANLVFDLDPGSDGVPGSRTDIRGDDLPLLWFHRATNDPFVNPDVVDSTTYSLDVMQLPVADSYAANGSLLVAPLMGHPPSEVVMQQGTRFQEVQRELTPGCVAAIRLAMAGFDRIQGTADDYIFELQYVGFTLDADILIGFDDSQTLFAVSIINASAPFTDHYVINRGQIYFNTSWRWYFNQELDVPVPVSFPEIWSIF